MTVRMDSRNRIAQQIAVCDHVIERLTHLDSNHATLADLIADVRMLRVSLQQALTNPDADGSQPSI